MSITGLPTRRPRRRAPFGLPTGRAVTALMLREMSTSYGRSPGGYLWAIFEPVAMIAALVAIFSVGIRMRMPGLGESFAVFYATGVAVFYMYLNIAAKLAMAVKFSRQLLAYPRVTWADALIARLFMTMITQFMVAYIVLGGVLILFDEPVVLKLPEIALAFAIAIALGMGVGTLNCVLSTLFPIWHTVWGIFSRPLILISGIIFLYDRFPEPWKGYLWWNPLIHPVGLMRKGFYPGYDALYISILYPMTFAVITLALGLLLMRRFHGEMLDR